MCQEFATVQGRLAALHRLNEAIFLSEVAGHNILYNFIRIAAMFVGALLETRLQIGSEMNFHSLNNTGNSATCLM
jgi:hypothetical protein